MTIYPLPMQRGLSVLRVPAALRRIPAFGRDFAVVLLVIGVYFLLRGAAPTRIAFSMEVTRRLVSWEEATGTFREQWVQRVSIHYYWVQEVANFTYAYLHFPVLAAVGGWLWWAKGRERFVFMRNVMFISMVIGLAFYYLVPAAPPRLLAANGYNLGFTDTVFGGNTSVNYAQPSLILNEYAAIPSFHFGWIAMASAAVWVNTASRVLRAIAVALSVAMSWAIVASANHLFFDMALGGLVVGASWLIAARIERRQKRGVVMEFPVADAAVAA
ncbi:MAG: phosphatase PAP2 family protein [Chloroflexi bacterium]|nr:phosphatase PAP2 family protein [Chloroflexota bacterium]